MIFSTISLQYVIDSCYQSKALSSTTSECSIELNPNNPRTSESARRGPRGGGVKSVTSAPRQRINNGRLHEDEPTISNGQSEHDQYLQRAEELPVDDALVRHVLVDEGETRGEEAHEICPYESPLYLRIVYVTRPQYHDALREDQGAEEAGEYPTHPPFPVAFHAEEQLRRPRVQVTDPADGEGCDGMHEQESVQSLSGEEIIG